MNNKLFKNLSAKDIIILKLEQPELATTIEKLEELKEASSLYYNTLQKIQLEIKDDIAKKEDNYVLKEIEQIGCDYKKDGIDLRELRNLMNSTESKLTRINSMITDIEKDYTVLKKEECEQCNSKETLLLPVNNKKICAKCYESNLRKIIETKKNELKGRQNE